MFSGSTGKRFNLCSGVKLLKWLSLGILLTVGGLTCISRANALSSRPEADPSGLRFGRVVLQLKWYHQFQFAGYYAALENGYYLAEGLAVELRPAQPRQDITADLLAGRADYLVSGPRVLLQWAQGQPLVMLAAIFQHSPHVLVARQDSGIRTPADLVGKRIMFNPATDIEFLGMCRNEGIELKDVVILPHSWDPEALLRQNADALSANVTNEPYHFRKRQVPVTVIEPLTYGIDFYGDCLVTTRKEVEAHPPPWPPDSAK